MRTAEEILNNYDDSAAIYWQDAIAAINEARKEAIEECAKKARLRWVETDKGSEPEINLKSILSLIKELK